MTQTLLLITLGTYLGTSLCYLVYVLFRPRRLVSLAYGLALLGLGVHTLGLILILPERQYPFILSNSDAYAIISAVVALVFLVLVRIYRFQGAGAFFMIAATSLLILSLFSGDQDLFRLTADVSPWVLIHLLLAFLAFSVFVVSFVVGIAFILLEARIKSKQLGGIVRRLPPLEVLDSIHYKALGMGLLLLTASIIAGTILNKVVQGAFIIWDPKQLWVFFAWFLYALLLGMRIRSGWRGRQGILLSILGFVIVIMAFFGLQHVP